MPESKKASSIKAKNSFVKCSSEGCRKKAETSGKCRMHADTVVVKEAAKALAKKSPGGGAQVKSAVSRIKALRSAAKMPVAKREVQARVQPAVKARGPQDGYLNTLCFWVGASLKSCKEALAPKE
ncbi:MAG: hypothetical protein HQL28_03200 [Candidatus Omnitrophica bacterium]|nr:hypothetical protein [Candidatus Omnitrophota bacterium]